MSVKLNPLDVQKNLTANDSNITNPVEIVNVLNNYFSSISSKTKVNIKYSHKYFSGFLKKQSSKDEIPPITSLIDYTKLVVFNSIPTEILKFLIAFHISYQLADFLNMCFTSGAFWICPSNC